MSKGSILKFLGNGSCLNPKFGNNSAYYFDEKINRLFLIDCGESIFERIHETSEFKKAKEIVVLITHMHTDHVGSLPSLIFSCKYEKDIVPTIIYPNVSVMKQFLTITLVPEQLYSLVKPDSFCFFNIRSIAQQHIAGIEAYGYVININNKKIFYSGDSKTINYLILNDFLCGYLDYFYQDVSIFETPAHLNIKELEKLIPQEKRKNVTCMHFDSKKSIETAKALGFKVATVHTSKE